MTPELLNSGISITLLRRIKSIKKNIYIYIFGMYHCKAQEFQVCSYEVLGVTNGHALRGIILYSKTKSRKK